MLKKYNKLQPKS